MFTADFIPTSTNLDTRNLIMGVFDSKPRFQHAKIRSNIGNWNTRRTSQHILL